MVAHLDEIVRIGFRMLFSEFGSFQSRFQGTWIVSYFGRVGGGFWIGSFNPRFQGIYFVRAYEKFKNSKNISFSVPFR
jgi:hypothetical protein